MSSARRLFMLLTIAMSAWGVRAQTPQHPALTS